MRQSVFYPAIFGYTLGVFGRSFFTVPFSFEIPAVAILGAILILLVSFGKMHEAAALRRYSLVFLSVVGLLFAMLGALRYSFFALDRGDPLLSTIVSAGQGRNIQAEGVVAAEPDERASSTRVTVAIDTIIEESPSADNSSTSAGSRKILLSPTKVIMSADPNPALQYGDRVAVRGTLISPSNFLGDNGRIFDYVSYLAKDKIFYEVRYANISVISAGHGDRIETGILFLKSRFLEGLDAFIPAPESSLAAGLVIAGKRALPSDIQNDFERSGTIQVIVLSGYNVTVVAEALEGMFAFLPVVASASLGVIGIIVFTIAAGATATVIRASVMAFIVITAKLSRRRYDVLRALVFSAFVMLIGNPLLLVFDPSFQLSFIATFGLVVVSPIIEKYFIFMPEALAIRGTSVATVATQIFVLPFLLYLTGTFSLVAVPANLLIFLFIPVTMLVCFSVGLLGVFDVFLRRSASVFTKPLIALVKPLTSIAAIPGTALLRYELFVVHVFASLPFAAFVVPAFPAWLLCGAYVCYVVVLVRFYRLKRATERTPADVTVAVIQAFHPSPENDSRRVTHQR